jgi:hypothetical protein
MCVLFVRISLLFRGLKLEHVCSVGSGSTPCSPPRPRLLHREYTRPTLSTRLPSDGLVAQPVLFPRLHQYLYSPSPCWRQPVNGLPAELPGTSPLAIRGRLHRLHTVRPCRSPSPGLRRLPPPPIRLGPSPVERAMAPCPIRPSLGHRHRHGDGHLLRAHVQAHDPCPSSQSPITTSHSLCALAPREGAPPIRWPSPILVLGYPGSPLLPSRPSLCSGRPLVRPRPHDAAAPSGHATVDRRPQQTEWAPIHKPVESAFLHCDSSNYGWGAVLNDSRHARGFWSATDHARHITWKELKAVRLAVSSLLPFLRGRRVLLHKDNQTVCAIFRNNTSRSPTMMTELR